MIPFWIRELQTSIEADYTAMRTAETRRSMRKIQATLTPGDVERLAPPIKTIERDEATRIRGIIVHTSLRRPVR